MLFNTLDFFVYIVIVLVTYYSLRKVSHRNLFLLIASYVFYGWWDYRFLSLIIISSACDFFIGKKIHASDSNTRRKQLLLLSLGINLGMLGLFKYYNFFIDSLIDALAFFNLSLDIPTIKVVLPVGISFYTFQTLSYTIDIYRRKIKPTDNWIEFFTYVSFFPQLVAGPIERAGALLPQFKTIKKLDYNQFKEGLVQILWGLFKKVVIADQCAVLVNDIFANHAEYSSPTLMLGTILFAFQIYGDFSGYSDIAIGTAKLLGFKLMRNFAYPYFSRDIAEFWRRWHISLSTWFRDYLYIPLGGSRVDSKLKLLRNIMVIFLVSGFWHGANWTFIIWGALHALYFIPLIFLNRNRRNMEIVAESKHLPSFYELFSMLLTFAFVCFAWIFFRAENIGHAFSYINGIAAFDINLSDLGLRSLTTLFFCTIYIGLLTVFEWLARRKEYPFQNSQKRPIARWAFYLFIGVLIIIYGGQNDAEFIYFQF